MLFFWSGWYLNGAFALVLLVGSFVVWAPPNWDMLAYDFWKIFRFMMVIGIFLGLCIEFLR